MQLLRNGKLVSNSEYRQYQERKRQFVKNLFAERRRDERKQAWLAKLQTQVRSERQSQDNYSDLHKWLGDVYRQYSYPRPILSSNERTQTIIGGILCHQ